MIDSYTQQYITKEEFESRIQVMRKNLKITEEQKNKLSEQQNLTKDIEMVVTNLEYFSSRITENVDTLDWHAKRDIMRRVIRRIEVSDSEINVVYRVNKPSEYKNGFCRKSTINRLKYDHRNHGRLSYDQF